MNENTLNKILNEHKKWLINKINGIRANLYRVNLSGTDLRKTDLREADLSGANLSGTDLSGTDLRWANLREANLRGADLREADLREADLHEVDLSGTDLSGADLRGTKILYMDMSKHSIMLFEGYLYIGCIKKPIDIWVCEYKKIGKRYGYSDDHIEEYGKVIKKLCSSYINELIGK